MSIRTQKIYLIIGSDYGIVGAFSNIKRAYEALIEFSGSNENLIFRDNDNLKVTYKSVCKLFLDTDTIILFETDYKTSIDISKYYFNEML